MKRFAKISGVVFLVIILLVFVYLSFNLEKEEAYTISMIELVGDVHLTPDQYFTYAKLNNKNNYSTLTLPIIKDRIEKHPYILNADVKYDGLNKVTVTIKEKSFDALILNRGNKYLITEKFELLPVLPFTRKIDCPVISNPKIEGGFKTFSLVKNQDDIILASKIITAVKLLDPALYQHLSEIDLRNGGDILFYLSSIDYPVVLGRGEEIRKVVYFNRLWSYLKNKDVNSIMSYIDLRFENYIYLGLAAENEHAEDGTI